MHTNGFQSISTIISIVVAFYQAIVQEFYGIRWKVTLHGMWMDKYQIASNLLCLLPVNDTTTVCMQFMCIRVQCTKR